MFINVYYHTKTSTIHLWEEINGERFYRSDKWVPYVFVRSNDGDTKTPDGKTVKKKEFNNYFDYYRFQRDKYNIYENRIKPEIQFLAEYYAGIPDEEIKAPNLVIYSVDIEVHCEDGFPSPDEAEYPIVLVSICSNVGIKKTWGIKPYNGELDFYVHCRNEADLLNKFFNWMHDNSPDVITGWNIEGFDLPYFLNRCETLWGESGKKKYSLLSPINDVRKWTSKKDGKMNIDIAGVSHLDYFSVFRWYHPQKLPSYSLENVSQTVIEKGKIDYSEYSDLRTLYYENWDMYVDYNFVDAKRVIQLEEKLGYIKELIQGSALLTKTPMKFYSTQSSLVEGMMLTHFRRNNMCAPYFAGGSESEYQGARVKEPKPGLYEWVFSIDIASSYPTAIITLNMSSETFFGKIIDMTEDDVMYHSKEKDFQEFKMLRDKGITEFKGKRLRGFNEALKRKLLCVAPNGSVFMTDKPGVLATVEKEVFFKRKAVKKEMSKMIEDGGDKDRIAQLNALQQALKIVLNGTYGITAVAYSRYFQPYIAEAITSCGRQAFLAGERYSNEILNNPNQQLLDIFEEINNASN